MRHPSVIAEYVRTYHDERKRLSAKATARRAHLELRLDELNREIDRLVDAIAKGHGDPAVLGPRSSVLDEERKQVARELNVEPAVGDVISLHPALLARYEQQLVHLQDAAYHRCEEDHVRHNRQQPEPPRNLPVNDKPCHQDLCQCGSNRPKEDRAGKAGREPSICGHRVKHLNLKVKQH